MSEDKIFELIKKEERRQSETLMMIPSENYASQAVNEVIKMALMNKYPEGSYNYFFSINGDIRSVK